MLSADTTPDFTIGCPATVVPLFVAVVLFLVVGAERVSAISVIAPSFAELVDRASEIVRVEVVDVTSSFDRPDPNSPIHTYVRARVLKTLKGDAREEITLRLLGGMVGDSGLEVVGMPQFVRGRKYILFVSNNGTAFCPLVAIMHGQYHVVIDEQSRAKTERVLRYDGTPLMHVAGVALPLQQHALSDGPGSPIGTALSVTEFEQTIAAEIANPAKNISSPAPARH